MKEIPKEKQAEFFIQPFKKAH